MIKIGQLIILGTVLLLLASCTRSSYNIKISHSIEPKSCVDGDRGTGLIYEISPEIPQKITSVDASTGKRLESISVDLGSFLKETMCSISGSERSATVYVDEYNHRTSFSADTGYTSVAVRILLTGKIDCGDGELRVLETSQLSKRYWSKFLAGKNDIQNLISRATQNAAVGLSNQLHTYCLGGEMEQSPPQKSECPPGWEKTYDGCDPG